MACGRTKKSREDFDQPVAWQRPIRICRGKSPCKSSYLDQTVNHSKNIKKLDCELIHGLDIQANTNIGENGVKYFAQFYGLAKNSREICHPLNVIFLGEERLLFSSRKDEDKKQIEIQIQY